ncbi:CRP/FNR family transcriptional regulator, anaerobic regulatory protein [Trichlorobacter thiogenes]|uniref:CRP/FNR family transcriptional regulator, anaerobic regulatory protein n=1 Tax=Trichlorobacter thiogenes TaxID=115783 RepID=A0A1T4SBN3_9BACT|nr:Crp/Fnr family transcriptional regulator [Trichlorobacter thiogenes]SKA25605.1 CRP/FNR family transcriptional regulator, anaerobic regulatory protein [Trichlorobacter thiogenes]
MSKCICNKAVASFKTLSHVCIGNLWVFEDLLPEEKAALASSAIRKGYKKGDLIFIQGEAADKMFLLKAGCIKISKISKDGNEAILDIRKTGDFLGEQIFWEDFKYPGTAICMQDSYICGFDKAGFEKMILENPRIGLVVIKNLSKHIEFLNSRASCSILGDLKNKLYELLLNLGGEYNNSSNNFIEIDFPISHEELGFLIGAHRVSITKAMNLLKKTGLIRKEGRNLFVCKTNTVSNHLEH